MSERTKEQLREMQSLPLERKILISQARIIEWYRHWGGKVYVGFSGGKDSTVLLHMVRQVFPEVRGAFVNTGLEYPEIRRFALQQPNVIELRPRWGRRGGRFGKNAEEMVSFADVLRHYGYPLISKEISQRIEEARRKTGGFSWKRLNGQGKAPNGEQSRFNAERWKPLLQLPIKISANCCNILKKTPTHRFQKEEGCKPYIGTMACESRLRTDSWIKNGCNAFKGERSAPMSFWTEQDVLRYIAKNDVEICSVYGEIIYQDKQGMEYYAQTGIVAGIVGENTQLMCSGTDRTGCVFCAFGAHLEKGETRFQRLKRTHPRLYEYCFGGGEWVDNPDYDMKNQKEWNPQRLWMPSKAGLGMAEVFKMVNRQMGRDILRW